MTNIIHIIPEPPNIKNNIKKVEKRIKEASDEISKAKKELNNANHSELSYEINQLESMYKKNNQYASEFETFASKVETMVNEYITTDKNCANKIRSNGKSHRQKTGLPKGLGAALISSSFEKLGDIIDDISDSVKEWVDGILDDLDIPFLDWLAESIAKDFDSWIQVAGSVITGVVCLITIAGATVGGPVALGLAMVAGVSYLMQLDKFAAGFADILDLWETDGKSVTQNVARDLAVYMFGDKLGNILANGYDLRYNITDAALSFLIGKGLGSTLTKLDRAAELMELGKLTSSSRYLKHLTDLKKFENVKKFFESKGIWDSVSVAKNLVLDFIRDGNPKNTLGDIDSKIIDTFVSKGLNTVI